MIGLSALFNLVMPAIAPTVPYIGMGAWVCVFALLLSVARCYSFADGGYTVRVYSNNPYDQAGAAIDAAALCWILLALARVFYIQFGVWNEPELQQVVISIAGFVSFAMSESLLAGIHLRTLIAPVK